MTSYTMSRVVRWKTPKRVGLVVLFKSLTGSAELVKVRKTLWNGKEYHLLYKRLPPWCAVYSFPSSSEINEVHFPFVLWIKKDPVSSATTYKRRFAKTHTETKFSGSSLETRLSVDVRSTISRKTWMGDREKICCPLTGWTSSLHMRHWCCSLVAGVKKTALQKVVLVCHKVLSYGCRCSDLCQNTNRRESLSESDI